MQAEKVEAVVQETIPCPDCRRLFMTDNALNQHRKDSHGVAMPGRDIPCPTCKRTFRDETGLAHHVRMKHQELGRVRLYPAELPNGRLRCPYCTAEFAAAGDVYNHVRSKHKGRAHAHLRVPGKDDDEPSLADLAVDAHIKREMGEPLEEWEAALLGED